MSQPQVRLTPSPRFGAFICHEERRDPESQVRIFKFELTNDTSRYPLGRAVCPESGIPGKDHPLVALASQTIDLLGKLDKESRLEFLRRMIRMDSKNWDIGPKMPNDQQGECLADRGERLLQESTADLVRNSNGSLSMIMDYDMDLKGKSLTELLKQKKSVPSPNGSSAPQTTMPRLQITA
jgi:hypothetical protein